MTAAHFDYISDLALTDAQVMATVEDAKDWCHCYGLTIRTPEHKDSSDVCQIAPFALFPSPFPRHLFQLAQNIQQAMSELYFRVSYDVDFLQEALAPVVKYDEFTRHMLDILCTLRDEDALPELALLIQRADYMCHVSADGNLSLKQIEVNNIAASMGGLGQLATTLHKRLIRAHAFDTVNCPVNPAIDTIGRGIHSAWCAYGNPKAIVLVVVEEQSQNAMDQRFVEFHIEDAYEQPLRSVRLTLIECHSRLSLSEDKELMLDGGRQTVSIVYFRAGYDPSSYPTEHEWSTRLLIERSRAVKCPWIGLQLANTKKIQQKLSEYGVLERYMQNDLQGAAKIRQTFAGLWGLEEGNASSDAIVKDAIANPSRFVLKPQLEGGARNYYGAEVAEKLTEFSADERAAHILMERVNPLVVKNYLVRARAETPPLSTVVSELGIFGALLGDGHTLSTRAVFNGGHILRTKFETVDAGGVAVGAAVIDSPYLI